VFSTADTIVAIATPPGRGGIGVVRVSGAEAHSVAARITTRGRPFEPRRATVTFVRAVRTPEDLRPDSPSSAASSAALAAPDSIEAEEDRINTVDQVIVTYFPRPASYTGDDVIELSAHGSPVVLKTILGAAVDAGARAAEPGEFTLRAYVNGRLDLMQAEAVADLIDAVTPLQARTAFDQLQGTLTRAIGEIDAELFDLVARLEASVDFPEEGYHFIEPGALAGAIDTIVSRVRGLLADARRGRLVREGLQVAIVGAPNVGKSSLFNALVGASRAIVTDSPGTTRDLVSETVDLEGLRVTLIDTAGLRDPAEVGLIEQEGIERAKQAARTADLVLVVAAGSPPESPEHQGHSGLENIDNKTLIVQNKIDVDGAWGANYLSVSARTGLGLSLLRERILEALDIDVLADRPEITNVRHIALVRRAQDALVRARESALTDGRSLSEEFVLADLQEARAALEEITGKRVADDVLAHIFSRFCVGK
jgi:tRNA modification GTPase